MSDRSLRAVDLNLLVVFDALMAERNVTRAAEHNGLSQPAVSKALNRLRHLLGDRLFERRDGRMEPTARALELAGPIRGALSEIARTVIGQSDFDPREIRGVFRIAAFDLQQSSLLPALVARLRQEAPNLDLQVRGTERSRLEDQLASGELDAAIAPRPAGASALLAEPLWRDGLATLIGRHNPIALPMTLQSFAAAPHVVDAGHVQIARDGQAVSLVDAILAASGLRRRIAVVLPSAAGVPHVVAATDLIATLPTRIVKDMAPLPGVRVVPAPLPPVQVSPHLLWHPRTLNSPARAWLRDMIRKAAAKFTADLISGRATAAIWKD